MSVYSIKDLERISSTKAHTIRIWEQRYGLLTPERTDTNVRYYNDDQLKKLLNVCTLLNVGLKISHISQMSKQQMTQEIDKLLTDHRDEDAQIEAIINQSLISTATFDATLFTKNFEKAVSLLGWVKTYERIIYPLLVRTGLMWMKDDLLPSQEHFLSNLIRQKLFSAIDRLPPPGEESQKWLLFLNEEEDHEIGLLFAHYLIRQHGHQSIYLGVRVPYNDLSKVVAASNPTHIYSFFVGHHEQKASEVITRLSADFEGPKILISGSLGNMREYFENSRATYVPNILKLTEILHAT
ncbi:MerR family transcriptional regulator [Dyadobacter luticola]|uniref:MerR family transcriptional regulator n=1 Tax=Dyadobacter luticola TaxID=1979387 RepID=A0A5R9L4W2_9BACT|nr:MerR family transcriptional regulator [Dyadobacter luticola]TLV03458.1 MerR family transcriptional regulator [Dyadobacter luticola]